MVRLSEIIEENRMIMKLNDFEESYEAIYSTIISDLAIFHRLRGIRLHNYIHGNVIPFREDLIRFINTYFCDDPDIDALKRRYSEMLENLPDK